MAKVREVTFITDPIEVTGKTTQGRRYVFEDGSELVVFASVENPPLEEILEEDVYEVEPLDLAFSSDGFSVLNKALQFIERETGNPSAKDWERHNPDPSQS